VCRVFQVRRAWYEMGFVPELLEVQVVAGKPILLLDDWEKTKCHLVVLEALKKVHGLSVFGPMNAGSVHGDAREGNIMVRRKEGVFEVKFIDFDWAGQDSVSTYPFKMNHA
jgi:Ser/Thr protein kinase RdoA (MazF antagonist)